VLNAAAMADAEEIFATLSRAAALEQIRTQI
jgi:hypothetical protein